jgi:hypothetical protein
VKMGVESFNMYTDILGLEEDQENRAGNQARGQGIRTTKKIVSRPTS